MPDGLTPQAAQRDHLAEQLNYNFCGTLGDLENVFDLRDGGYGYAFKVSVPAIECLPGGAALCAGVIDLVIKTLPTGYTCQFVRRTVSNIRRQMMAYADVPSVGELAETFAQARLDQFAQASQDGFVPDDANHNFFPGSEEMYFFISTPDFGRLSVARLVRGQQLIDDEIQNFRSCIQAIKRIFQSVNLQAEPLDAGTFAQYVVSLLNVRMIEERPYTPKVIGDELPEAIGKAVTLEDLDNVGFVSLWNKTRTYYRCLSMIWQPDGVKPGMVDEVVSQERDCAFVMTVRILDTRQVMFGLRAKRYLAGKMRMGGLNGEEIDELDSAIGDSLRRAVNGERFVNARFNILITDSSPSKVEDRAAMMSRQLARCNMEYVDVERDIGPSIILNGCLPFPRHDYERAFARARRMLSADAAAMMPMGGTWSGTLHKPYALYANRAGRPFLFNPMVSPRNSNFLVVADSGSGKSFWINDLLTQTARLPGAYQFIVSMKPDYRKYATQFGTEIDLNLHDTQSISPFWGEPTNDAIDLWAKIVLGMVAEHPSVPSGTEIKQAISLAVTIAARRNWEQSAGHRELQLTDIQLELANSASGLGEKLAKALFDYVDNGRYAKLFQGPSMIKPGQTRRIFFNLRGIMGTDAGHTALMCVMRTIDAVMSDERLRGVPKLAIFDEGWSLVASEFGGAFIERAVRTYRSLGGTVGFITQDPRDLDTTMGRAVLGNTATKVVLPLDPNVAGTLSNYMDLNTAEASAIASLRLVKGIYSEFFVKMAGVGATVARLVPFPLLYAMNTTSPDDEAEQYRMLGEGLSCREMLERFAAQYPRGVFAAESSGQGVL